MNRNTFLAVITVVLIGAIGYYALSGSPEPNMNDTTDVEYMDEEISTSPDTGITSQDVLENPDVYEGSIVTVRSEVEEWLTPRAFTLDARGVVNDTLLVITATPTYIFEDEEFFGDNIWEVRGTVKRFDRQSVSDSMQLDLAPEIFDDYQGEPYIEADIVQLFEE